MQRKFRTVVAVLGAVLAVGMLPSSASAATVCANAVGAGSYKNIYGKGGDLVAKLWYHETRDRGVCTVLRAVKWKGTPHYMRVRSCADVGRNCSGIDAGKYREYAGPIYWRNTCVNRVVVDSPAGDRVVDGWYWRCN